MRGKFPCIEIAGVRLDAGLDPGDEEVRDNLLDRINAAISRAACPVEIAEKMAKALQKGRRGGSSWSIGSREGEEALSAYTAWKQGWEGKSDAR